MTKEGIHYDAYSDLNYDFYSKQWFPTWGCYAQRVCEYSRYFAYTDVL